MSKESKQYEEVAQHLLNEFAEVFKLGTVEGKQIVPGQSGTNWTVDAKGVRGDGEGFLIIECRRKTTRNLEQEAIGAIAFRIYRCWSRRCDSCEPSRILEGC